jgi:hypothetical protein
MIVNIITTTLKAVKLLWDIFVRKERAGNKFPLLFVVREHYFTLIS